ncbi:MAG TPA: S1C family serine protease [Candidatus Dormibacteraeota bacterium]|nr:S1C family serine protease [Candidatus Dormibacteraeota bacterium]
MSNNLKEYSDQLAAVVESAAASVVTVAARPGKPATGTTWEDGVVVTSSHAVLDEENISVRDSGGDHKATLAGRDHASDIAVLRVEGLSSKPAARGGSARTGSVVLAIGRPSDLRASVGHVVSTEARQSGWRGGLDGLVLSDAHLYEGFSGGPLVDAEGKLVGLNSWYYGRGSTRSLTVEAADHLVKSLLAHGRVKKPYLGIGTQPVFLAPEAAQKAGQDRGLMVIGVEEGSPAAAAGLLQGDILVGIDGDAVAGMRHLFRSLQRIEVDSEHALKVVRGGEAKELKVKVGEKAEPDQG